MDLEEFKWKEESYIWSLLKMIKLSEEGKLKKLR